ncbi:MAG: quinone-dependent dihydroorotate dehydrogenase [Rhodococcus sp. (in: high G+C Gram-positive bacteria)]
MYRALLRMMFLVPPERIHHLAFGVLRAVALVPPLRYVAGKMFVADDPRLRSTVFGIDFPAPLGLAAGFDKNADGIDSWAPIGFGFAEIGTVTAQSQPGNPQPRLFRLPLDRAIVNRMGFNNLGAEHAALRLRTRRTHIPIGANIGKTKVVEPAGAAADYTASAGLLGPLADFVVVNVSSPNTPGLRDLQAVESLRPILVAVQAVVTVPVLVKIAPDLSDEDIDAVADLAVELGLDGIVATNTTISRAGLRTESGVVDAIGAGGLSGAPVADRSLEVLRRLYRRVGTQLTLISVGGIETEAQAWERITAGASLIQGYTGFVYGGPLWIKSIHRGLSTRLEQNGFATIADAVGSANRP